MAQKSTRPNRANYSDKYSLISREYLLDNNEFNRELRGDRGRKVFNKMKRTDSTVNASLAVVRLPITGAEWNVSYEHSEDHNEEVIELVKKHIFNGKSWRKYMREMFNYLHIGFQVFEVVWDIDENGVIYPEKLQYVRFDDIMDFTEEGIRIMARETFTLPYDKAIILVNEQEGENMWGTSLLRPAYKHWYLKEQMEKIDAMASEKHGLGIPTAKVGPDSSDDKKRDIEAILENIRANEKNYIVYDNDFEVEMLDMKSRGLKDLMPSINHHDRKIWDNVLAAFMTLGAPGSAGSYSLGETQSDMFYKSLQYTADYIAEEIQHQLVHKMVRYNFPTTDVYPIVTCTNIDHMTMAQLSEVYERLIKSGGLKASEDDEVFLRNELGLPEITDEERERREKAAVVPVIENEEEEEDEEEDEDKNPENIEASDKGHHHHLTDEENARFKFADTVRKPDPRVELRLQALDSQMEQVLTEIGKEQAEGVKQQWKKALDIADRKERKEAIEAIAVPKMNDYQKGLYDLMLEAMDLGVQTASDELREQAITLSREIKDELKFYSQAITDKNAQEVLSTSHFEYRTLSGKKETNEVIVRTMGTKLKELVEKKAKDVTSMATIVPLNEGRDQTFTYYEDKIYAMQYSAIIDSVTSPICNSLNGVIVDYGSRDYYNFSPPNHNWCRSIWVAILKDEDNLPDITGVSNASRRIKSAQ